MNGKAGLARKQRRRLWLSNAKESEERKCEGVSDYVKGLDSATGYISWCYKNVAEEDAVAVSILKKAGAVLYVKSNNPQTLLVRTTFVL